MKPNLPKEPPPGLLMSMAIRYDHAIGCDGFYDNPPYGGTGPTHEQRKTALLIRMGQLYEEVSGYGFYKWPEEAPPLSQSPAWTELSGSVDRGELGGGEELAKPDPIFHNPEGLTLTDAEKAKGWRFLVEGEIIPKDGQFDLDGKWTDSCDKGTIPNKKVTYRTKRPLP